MITTTSHEQSLVRGKYMAEKVLGLILLLIFRSSVSNIRKLVLKIESIVSISSRGVAPN